MKNTKTADDAGSFNLYLQCGETDIAADDDLGKIIFQAPDEATTGDSQLNAAAIQARSEGDFSSTSNATSLDFMLGVSEAAATKMTLNSTGNLSVGDGTAALPSYSNVGDLNTGIYFPAADTVGVTVGGTEQFRFGSNPIPGGLKNLLINGSMAIAQRGTQTSVGASDGDKTACDMWKVLKRGSPEGRVTATQTADTNMNLNGHEYTCKLDCTTAEGAVASTEAHTLSQAIEAQHLQGLKFGTANAKAVTLSFWFSSPKTGIHCASLYLSDTGYSQVKEFTIASANTWEYFSLTFSANTSQKINNDTGSGMIVSFALTAGSNFQVSADAWASGEDFATSNQQNLLDNTANNVSVAGVQLEIGSVATDFEYKDLSIEFYQCFRYYRRITHNFGQAAMPVASVRSDENQKCGFPLEPPMRAGPSLETSGNANDYNMNHGNGNTVCDAVPSLTGATSVVAALRYQTDGGPSAGFASQLEFLEGSGAGFLGFSAEL